MTKPIPVIKSAAITVLAEIIRVRNYLQKTNLHALQTSMVRPKHKIVTVIVLFNNNLQVNRALPHDFEEECHLKPIYMKIVKQELP